MRLQREEQGIPARSLAEIMGNLKEGRKQSFGRQGVARRPQCKCPVLVPMYSALSRSCSNWFQLQVVFVLDINYIGLFNSLVSSVCG